MNITVDITLPLKLSREAQNKIVGTPEAEHEEVIHRGKVVQSGNITLSASIKQQKVMGYRPLTTLHVSWDAATSRADARSAFLAYLQQQGLPPKSIEYYGVLFDSELAFDEEGIFV